MRTNFNPRFETTTFKSFARKAITIFMIALLSNVINAQNAITTENALPGNPASEWDIDGAGDLSIQGFATNFSIHTGATVSFKIDVKAPATNFNIKIYRLGYYNGNGARRIADMGNFAGTQQPAPLYEVSTGKTDCSNWSTSASWNSAGAVSGVYIAKLTRADNSGSSHIIFIVRNDTSNSAILFKTSDTTWQAYNGYGGNSLYVNNSGTAVSGFNHATKVSYNRPFYTRSGGGGSSESEDWLFNAEYPMIRWMERNGYDVSYTTDVDMDRDTTPITPAVHKVMISVGHDEYWSAAERQKFETARNNGVHLAFFSGNEVYWKTRWEDNHRTLVCYKEGAMAENGCGFKCDTSTNVWTGTWRDGMPAQYPNSDAGQPENSLTGQISWDGSTTSIEVPQTYKNLRFWRNTSIAELAPGQTITFPYGTLGYEWDFEQYEAYYPVGRITLSKTTSNNHTHKLSLYRHSSGALVFGAGTVQWSWGLDSNHDRGNDAPSIDMQQATINLFADMGVQPATLQSGLDPASASTDVTPPVSVINNPIHGESHPANIPIIISGTASDTNGIVALVEVSVDDGVTWKTATGTSNWTYTWTPLTEGPVTIQTHAVDDSYNIEPTATAPASNAITINITEGVAPVCPCTIFNPASVPVNITEVDNAALELGVKFKPTENGFITGIRFYKGPLNTGTHIGSLWSSAGVNLAQATFSSESASGWQQVLFASPVAVVAGTTYVASYHTNTGNYSQDTNAFSSEVNSYYLTALEDGAEGVNGVYSYAATPTFPTSGWQASNYWVDVVFNTSVGEDVTPPVIVSVSPLNGSTSASITTHPSAVFNELIDSASANSNSFKLTGPGNVVVPGTISCTAATITFTPAAPLTYNTAYTITIKGGNTQPHVTDIAGNYLSADYSWSFTTASPPPPPPTEGPGGPILVISAVANPFSRYTVEILRAEGLNEFTAMDISLVNAATLNNHDVIILGEINVNASQVTMLTTWVNNGGTLIAFKPNASLLPLLGISAASGTLADKYLLINTTTGPGVGLVNETIQFHGAANNYNLGTATSLATLYSSAGTATTHPAVTSNNVGSNGGKAIAFTYDLPKSIVYTRQGNPAYIGQERDGQPENLRSSDMFFPDYIDLNKVAIPQADEQQRLLANIIIQSNLHRKPLPRFWFLPRKLKAAVVMTGDDHGSGGTIARFNQYLGYGHNSPTEVANWEAVRGTSYVFTSTPLSNAQAAAFNAQGFEVALHLSTNCGPYNFSSLQQFFNTQMPDFTTKYTSIPLPTTNRTHCISWSDWASKPKVEVENGIRLNTDYYYWPAAWIQNRPGMFTGSGMPMRFADLDGTIIDNYQVTTQMPDESGISYTGFIDTILDNALGIKGYYGVFCANMHTDADTSEGSDAIIASAIARQVPVISAKQLLTWLDARNGSSFGNILWSSNNLSFTVSVAANANNLQGMVPVVSTSGQLTGITRNGAPVSYTSEIIKGINYAFFNAAAGSYVATYFTDTTAPVITNIVTTPNTDGTATITWTTNELTTATVQYGLAANTLNGTATDNNPSTNHSITLTGLTSATLYYFSISATDAAANIAVQPAAPNTMTFVMPTIPVTCMQNQISADFSTGTLDATYISPKNDGEVVLAPIASSTFSGTTIPSGWASFPWTGGTSTVNGGVVAVNGSRLNAQSSNNCTAGSTMEFVATFGAASFQHIGFGGGSDAIGSGGIYNGESAWAMFSTGNSTSQLQARTFLGSAGATNINIGSPGQFTGSSHLYRIEWKTSAIEFYIDGVLYNTTPTAITGTMRPAISDYNNAAPGISVDWIQVSPYAPSGSFISSITDAGAPKSWGIASWTADVPSGTTLQISQRQANSALAVTSQPWTVIPSNGANIGGTSQFIQYKIAITTSDTAKTPILKDITFNCSTPQTAVPTIATNPISQIKCANESVSFISGASGNPIPTVQWQSSVDSTNWIDIVDAINPTLTIIATIANNDKKYRAVWTNSVGLATSEMATLTVNPLPTATINAVTNPVCPGGTVALQLTAATGASPYTLVVNGTTYPGVNVGQTFTTIPTVEQSIWGNTGSPVSPSVTDNTPIEVGTKFRSSANGFVTGVRFYKGLTNTGVHTAHLWSASGQLLATAVFASESASGWQEVRFASPVAITANTTYIASYLSAGGYFAISSGFFGSAGVTNGPLTALQSGVDGPNGVYKYGGGFPDGGNTANYWVDVLFSQANSSNLTYNLTSITDNNGCINNDAPVITVVIATSAAPSGNLVSAAASVCDGGTMNLIYNSATGIGPYSLVINGNTYNNVVSGTPFSVGTANFSGSTASIWTSAVGGSQTADNTPTELGVKIKSSIPGTITGIRFYKAMTGVFTFTGSLWSEGNSATPLATATYTSDSAPGWKVISFATPVALSANTSYRASYFSPNPNYYAYTASGLTAPITNGPLTAEASYFNQPGSGYPASSSTANYWVDVLFNSTSSTVNFQLTSITSSTGCISTGPLGTASVIVNDVQQVVTNQAACGSYTWPVSGLTYTTSGIHNFNTTNGSGCTIVNSLNLTINNSSTSTVSASAYGSYLWAVNGMIYNSSGTYTYTTTNAFGCVHVATLVLTINTPPSAVISGNTTICLGESANLTVVVNDGFAPFTIVYTDGTTNYTINTGTRSTVIPVSPTSTTVYSIVSVTDANGISATISGLANINVYQLYNFYVDADGDGYGADAIMPGICSINALTPPVGYSTNNGDCNDAIAAINPGIVEILYNGADDNCNGLLDEGFQLKTKLLPSICNTTLVSIGSLIGITTVNSTITGYRIRVTNGTTVQIIERNVPHFTLPNLAQYDYATTYTVEVELQRNGIWLGYYGDACLITSPSVLAQNGATQVVASQCGIVLSNINTLIATASLPGATGYRFKITNISPGANGPNIIQTIDRSLHWFSLQMLAQYNYNTTYRVEVAIKTTGAYSGFGSPCLVTTPESRLINCGGIINLPGTLVAATSLNGATQYRFELTRISNGAVSMIDRASNSFSFNMIAGYAPGTQYYVRVAVRTVNTWSPYGTPCMITSPGTAARFTLGETLPGEKTADAVGYPNPFTTAFNIVMGSTTGNIVNVKITDVTGRVIQSTMATVSEINTTTFGSAFPSGIYYIIISEGEEIKSIRMIKR